MSEDREPPDDPARNEERSRFLNSLGTLRPRLHRLCARMCGSVLDGEDLVQETLAAASYRLSPMPYPEFLERSLFRMSLERCMTFIRLDLGHRERTVVYGEGLTRAIGPEKHWSATPIEEPLASRVSVLRPYQRAVVVLKDVLGFSFVDTMELIGPTVGHVKSRVASRARHASRASATSAVGADRYGAAFDAPDIRRLLQSTGWGRHSSTRAR